MNNIYNKISCVCALIVTFTGAHNFANQVKTTVSQKSDVRYFHEEHHPMKMDWNTATMCWGNTSNSDSGELSSKEIKSTVNVGSENIYFNVPGPMKTRLAQSSEWDSDFDGKEYTFNVRIKKTVGDKVRLSDSSTCTDSDWTYKTGKSELQLNTSLELLVPDGVWIIRLKQDQFLQNASFKISGVYPLKNDKNERIDPVDHSQSSPDHQNQSEKKETLKKQNNQLVFKGYTYYFVQPKEQIKLDLAFSDNTVASSEYLYNLEITFLGYNRCEKSFLNEGFKFNREEIEKALNTVKTSTLPNQDPTGEHFHNATNFLACLGRQDNVSRMIFENDLSGVLPILDYVKSLPVHIVETQGAESRIAGTSSLLAFDVVTKMFRYQLSNAVMTGLYPYCQEYDAITSDGTSAGKIFAFEYAFNKFEKMLALLGWSTASSSMGKTDFITYYGQIITKLKQYTREVASEIGNANPTYEQVLKTKGRTNLENLLSAVSTSSKRVLMDEIKFLSYGLPGFDLTRTWEEYFTAVNELNDVVASLEAELAFYFRRVGTEVKAPVDFTKTDRLFASLQSVENKFAPAFIKAMSLVDASGGKNHMSDQFSEMYLKHYVFTRNWLSVEFKGFLKNFIESSVPNDSKRSLSEAELMEVKKCLIVK